MLDYELRQCHSRTHLQAGTHSAQVEVQWCPPALPFEWRPRTGQAWRILHPRPQPVSAYTGIHKYLYWLHIGMPSICTAHSLLCLL